MEYRKKLALLNRALKRAEFFEDGGHARRTSVRRRGVLSRRFVDEPRTLASLIRLACALDVVSTSLAEIRDLLE